MHVSRGLARRRVAAKGDYRVTRIYPAGRGLGGGRSGRPGPASRAAGPGRVKSTTDRPLGSTFTSRSSETTLPLLFHSHRTEYVYWCEGSSGGDLNCRTAPALGISFPCTQIVACGSGRRISSRATSPTGRLTTYSRG